MRAPAEIEGSPPQIAFAPCYLADGLEIGGTLCLSDELSPGICRHPSGRFCVIMPKRITIPAGTIHQIEADQSYEAQAA
jgi:hypothetical protein